jgi:predicted ATP-dependent serine protease
MLTVPVTEMAVGRAARLGYLNAQNLGLSTWQVGSQVSTVESDATLTSVCAAFGGDYARLRTDCKLVGRGATGRLRAVGHAAPRLAEAAKLGVTEVVAPEGTAAAAFLTVRRADTLDAAIGLALP